MLPEASRHITIIDSTCKGQELEADPASPVLFTEHGNCHSILFSRQNLRELSDFKGKGTKPRQRKQNKLGQGIRLILGHGGERYLVLGGD